MLAMPFSNKIKDQYGLLFLAIGGWYLFLQLLILGLEHLLFFGEIDRKPHFHGD